MWLIYIIDVVAVAALLLIGTRRGLEHALPVAAFILVLVPRDAAIPLPGLFDLTTQRMVLAALAAMPRTTMIATSAPMKRCRNAEIRSRSFGLAFWATLTFKDGSCSD